MHHTTNDIYIHIYIHIHIYTPKPCIPIWKTFLWNLYVFLMEYRYIHRSIAFDTLFFVGWKPGLSLSSTEPPSYRSSIIRRCHLPFVLLRILAVVPVTTDGAPSARPACPDVVMVCHNNNNTTWSSIIYIYY